MEKKEKKQTAARQEQNKKAVVQRYFEVVFEGHYKEIKGLLEGFKLGSMKSEYAYFFSSEAGIKTSTMTEILLQYITLKNKLHHVIMSGEFLDAFRKALKENEANAVPTDTPLGKTNAEDILTEKRLIRSAQEIKEASFTFKTETYGQKYGAEIKTLLNSSNIPSGLELHNYNPIESDAQSDKEQGRYAVSHEYSFQATGLITSTDLNKLFLFRQKLDLHPLIEPDEIVLDFADTK